MPLNTELTGEEFVKTAKDNTKLSYKLELQAPKGSVGDVKGILTITDLGNNSVTKDVKAKFMSIIEKLEFELRQITVLTPEHFFLTKLCRE